MANFEIPEDATFNPEMRMLERRDRAYAELLNGMFGQLLENESHLSGEILDIISGAQMVGDAGKLGGKLPEHYATAEQLDALKKSVSDGKNLVADAITGKGVTTATDAAFATMASNISTMGTNQYNAGVAAAKQGSAVAGNVLAGKTFTNASGVNLAGTMANQGAVSKALNCGESYSVPAGYHSGSGKVTANSLASQTVATATAEDIANGKTAWVNGVKVTGAKPIQVYLYKYGNECIDVTGGYTAIAFIASENYTSDGIGITRGSAYMIFAINNGNYMCQGNMFTKNKINLTHFDTLYVDLVFSNPGAYTSDFVGAIVRIFSSVPTASSAGTFVAQRGVSTSRVTLQLDISALSGEYNIGVYMYNCIRNYNVSITIYNIWLE